MKKLRSIDDDWEPYGACNGKCALCGKDVYGNTPIMTNKGIVGIAPLHEECAVEWFAPAAVENFTLQQVAADL